MSESIWAKEVHFGRRPRAASPVEAAEERAPRHRLIARRRQPLPPLPPSVLRILEENRAPRPAARPVVEPVIEASPDPEWGAHRRGEWWAATEEPSSVEVRVEAPDPSTELPVESPVETDATPAEKSSVLRRELHFPRRSRRRAAPERVVPEATAKADVVQPSVRPKSRRLRRELHLPRPSRKREGAHPVQQIIGLRVGSSHLSAAQVRNNGSAELLQLARTSLEPGLVVNGEVREPIALAKALKEFFAENKLPRKGVRLGIASNRIGVRVLDVPAIDDQKQFANALRFRAQELLPIPVADAILDHVLLEQWTDDEGSAMRRVLLVFAHRELVNRHVEACRSAGVRLLGVDLDPFALLRAVSVPRAEGDEPGDAVVAVAVGHDRTIVAVSDGRICDFTRVLDWGGASLDLAIAHALDLTPSQVENIKHGLTLGGGELPEGVSPVQLEAVKAAIKSEIAVLGRELVSSLRFYQSRTGSLSIGEVLLAGGSAHLDGLTDELQSALGATVRVADPFARVVLGKRLAAPPESAALAIAIGLGIED